VDSNDAILALRAAGIHAVAETPRLLVTSDNQRIRMANRNPTPSNIDMEMRNLETGERLLIQVKRLTDTLRARAEHDKRLIVTDGALLLIDGKLEPETEEKAHEKPKRGPKPFGQFAVARALLARSYDPTPLVQAELAERAGIKQPAVSEALKKLDQFVERTRVGWRPVNRTGLFDYAATKYPGAGGITTYWWHAEDVHTQVNLLLPHVEDPLVGGDLAAAGASGWRKPEHALMYLHTGIDPTQHGFVAGTRDDHTLELVVPADKTLWATARAFLTDRRTDPVITYYDVLRTGTTGDQQEAAEHLRDWFLGESR
jgi:hypothetical protein